MATYSISTDSGSYDDFVADSLEEALDSVSVPDSVRDASSFQAWLERVGGYGFIEVDGERIAEVKS